MRDRVRRAELAGLLALHAAADGFDESAILVVFHDAGVSVAVQDEDISGRIPGDVGLAAERVGLRRARRFGAGEKRIW